MRRPRVFDIGMKDILATIPYCGLPPSPAEIWARWNLDPTLLIALAALLAWHGHTGALSVSGRSTPAQRGFFVVGWLAVVLALASPLCALSVSLFSARVAQHMWITMAAAPLLVLAGSRLRPAKLRVSPMTSASLFAFALWAWHLPRLYDLTFRSDLAYWSMHVSLTAAALLLWSSLLRGAPDQWAARLCAGFVTIMHMGLLGALITLAPRTLYQAHLLTSGAWGFTPLEDQQLGGLIMWVPAGAALLMGGLGVLYGVLATGDRAVRDGRVREHRT